MFGAPPLPERSGQECFRVQVVMDMSVIAVVGLSVAVPSLEIVIVRLLRAINDKGYLVAQRH